MKLSFRFLFLSIMLVWLMSSCSDDSKPTANNWSYFPMKTGSYWIYNYYTLDSNGIRVNQPPTKDSITITGSITKQNKKGYIYTTYSFDSTGVSTSDVYFRTEKEELYAYTNIITDMMRGLPIEMNLEEQWLLIINNNDDIWRIFQQKFEGENKIKIGTFELEGEIEVNGEKGGSEIVETENGSFTGQEYIITAEIKINYLIPITIDRTWHIYFVENVGMVKTLLEPLSLSIPVLGKLNLDGSEQTLLRYKLK